MKDSQRRVLFTTPMLGNHCGVLTASLQAIATEMERRGFEVSILSPEDEDFLFKLLQFGQDPDALIIFGTFFYDLRISAQNHFQNKNVVEMLKCRTVCALGDHPFSNFMWERVSHLHESTDVVAAMPSFFTEAQVINPALHRYRKAGPTIYYVDKTLNVPYQDRVIDVLIPLSFDTIPGIDQILASLQGNEKLRAFVTSFYEALRPNRDETLIELLKPVMQQVFGLDFTVQGEERKHLPQLFSIVSSIDFCVRYERRCEMLKDLISNVDGRRICVVDRRLPDHLKVPGVKYVPELPATKLGELMGTSKAVVHAHPTYPDGLHERILHVMAAGSALLSDYVPALESSFEQNREWMCWRPGESINDVFERVGEENLEAMAERACYKAWSEHAPNSFVSRLLGDAD